MYFPIFNCFKSGKNTPSLAVTIPTESILVTSSYVNVPPIDTLPLNVPSTAVTLPEATTFPVTSIPAAKSTLVAISMCPSVLILTTLTLLPHCYIVQYQKHHYLPQPNNRGYC